MGALDKRDDPRVLVLKTGTIRHSAAAAATECAVLNVSASGACLLVPSDAAVAERFELVLDCDGTNHHCRMVWREGARIGVEFVPQRADHASAGPRDSDVAESPPV